MFEQLSELLFFLPLRILKIVQNRQIISLIFLYKKIVVYPERYFSYEKNIKKTK
ncbi:hypothetical protein C240_801 [Enterococcus sp. 5H]|nr:hypothetical protein [Enterococcus sp. 5H]